ncbi:MAG: hypothetical protein AB1411_00925 [Nitrospirota bacterium]
MLWTGVLALSMLGFLAAAGCAQDSQKPPPQQQIRSDSDRFFDKVKQEERQQGTGPQGQGTDR